MKTRKDLDQTTISAISCNIVRQAIREDWITTKTAVQVEATIVSLLDDRNIKDFGFALCIMQEITQNY